MRRGREHKEKWLPDDLGSVSSSETGGEISRTHFSTSVRPGGVAGGGGGLTCFFALILKVLSSGEILH